MENKNKSEDFVKREINLVSPKKDLDKGDLIADLADKCIHNLEEVNTIIWGSKLRNLRIELFTRDSSYDLSKFYSALTQAGYIIK